MRRPILAIETSCDETAVGLMEGRRVLAHLLNSQVARHRRFGGIYPELSSRLHVEVLPDLIRDAFHEAKLELSDLGAIAVTSGPGLIGALEVGVATARSLAYALNLPLVPINHLVGHLYSVFWKTDPPTPLLALIVSGGHTLLALLREDGQIEHLGETRDDAAGEAFDKVGRLLGLPYPGGPAIEAVALQGSGRAFSFPRPLGGSGSLDFSFSGLKTAVLYEVRRYRRLTPKLRADLAASFQEAVCETLATKLLTATARLKPRSVAIVGGVAANGRLRELAKERLATLDQAIPLLVPPLALCTDNAVMIGLAAEAKLAREKSAAFQRGWYDVRADANLPLSTN